MLDTGIYAQNEELGSRIVAFKDFLYGMSKCYDENGHGTHIAGIIGGDGRHSGGRYAGIAPGCHFIALKVLDNRGNGNVKEVVKGIEWVINNKERFRIRVMNISVGMLPDAEEKEKRALIQGVERAWDAGIVVVTAAGNNGPKPMSVTAPGISRKVITVGAIQERKVQNYYSGRGPTPYCIVKPEILAPGINITSCKNARRGYNIKSGTSMATPVVSGAICLLLEKHPALSPAEVKIRLHDSAIDMGLGKNQQGWGKLWIPGLLGK